MDWPLTAALGSLAAAVGVVSLGAVVVMRSDAPTKRASAAPVVAQSRPQATPSVAPAPAPRPEPRLASLAPTSAPPSVVVVAPNSLANELGRPFDPQPADVVNPPAPRPQISLPQLKQEPPPKVTKPAVAPAPAHPFSPPPPPKETRIPGVMTGSEIARIKAALRLTAEQLPLWHPVEAVLRDIGKHQMVQIRNGAKPDVDSSAMTKVYYAAQSLLATLRPDQKEQVRKLARSMGYASVASML